MLATIETGFITSQNNIQRESKNDNNILKLLSIQH